MRNKFSLLLCFFCFLSLVTFAQEVERVLVVPYGRMDFQSRFDLNDISIFNQFNSANEVYPAYVEALLSQLSKSDSSVVYYKVSDTDEQLLRRKTIGLYRDEPISHHGIDISIIKENGILERICRNMGVDKILFLTKYQIDGKILSSRSNFEGSKFINWSVHQMDYEIYNAKGELLAVGDRITMKPRNPNNSNYFTKGTVLADLERAYQKLGVSIKEQIDKNKKKNKVVYQIK